MCIRKHAYARHVRGEGINIYVYAPKFKRERCLSYPKAINHMEIIHSIQFTVYIAVEICFDSEIEAKTNTIYPKCVKRGERSI